MIPNKYPDTELQDALSCSADAIAKEAGEDFDAWRIAHDDDVGELDLLEQIEIYANDCAWHSRSKLPTI